MVNVPNRKCIRQLGRQSMKAARTRNAIAILAIALTTVLFTSLFTIALSINDGLQQSNFRQVGGFEHGGFKYLTQEQFEELREDPLIRQWSLRRFVGMPSQEPFNKSHVEVGYSDANSAHWMFCDPVEGRLPQEGTDEAATDIRVLELLGVEPEIGAAFTVTFDVDGVETTQTFTLCGWWEYDQAVVANHILVPESRVDAILAETGVDPTAPKDGMTGRWNLSVMFKDALHIERDMERILADHGYQNESRSAGDNYIAIGVNWGYSGAQLAENLDPATGLAICGCLLLIMFTGYLIIYNVFQISVTNDIRFYGLLKTIGTTPRQLKRIIRQQALLLSLAGIPLGLLCGWLVGAGLTPVIVAQLDGVVSVTSLDPFIFVASALFSLLTVTLSCRRPGRMAARVSPVEAVRYTEGGGGVKKKTRKSGKGAGLFAMARANLGRSRGKTVVTVLSLSLAVVLLNMTVTFTRGFDMDKYVSNFTASDFLVADAAHFQTGNPGFHGENAVPEQIIAAIEAQGGVTEGGRTYGCSSYVQEFVTEDYFRGVYGRWYDAAGLEARVASQPRTAQGLIPDNAQLYGMSPFALDHLRLLEGDLSKLHEAGGRYIAAVFSESDYGEPYMDSHWAKIGDTVTLRYVEDGRYVDPATGAPVDPEEVPGAVYEAIKYQDVDYEVVALVTVPYALSYRYYGSDEFILNDQTFIRDSGTSDVLYYAFDTTDEANADMESFLADHTENQAPQFDYESKATYVAEFESFRAMFLMMGGALSFIIGLVGILNFFNAILTGILARRREFAVLQSVGMTGKQLKTMLVWEGLFYGLGAVALALLLSIGSGPLLGNVMNSMFWFFTYRFTIAPIVWITPVFLALGVALPLAVYRFVARSTIVERLREVE